MDREETSEQTDASELKLETLIIFESGLAWDLIGNMGAGGNGNIVLVDLFETIEHVVAVETLDLSDTEEVGLVDLTSTESVLVSVKDALVWDLRKGIVPRLPAEFLQKTLRASEI